MKTKSMEVDLKGRQHQKKMTLKVNNPLRKMTLNSMEDYLKETKPQRKKVSKEDVLNERQLNRTKY